jgi:hypothetical protein
VGKIEDIVLWGLLVAEINIYHWKCVGKVLGENGMNEACEMEMSISRSRAVLRCMLAMEAK